MFKKHWYKKLFCLLVIACMITSSVSTVSAATKTTSTQKVVSAGATWVVAKTTNLSALTIGEGSKITAPGSYAVTMTVSGVETAIKQGSYKGNIVLTVTPKFTTNPSSYTGRGIDNYRTAIYIDKTGLVKSQSVLAAIKGKNVTSTSAENIKITSNSDNFTGIMVNGADYTIKNSTFNFKSNSDGSNVSDFNGYGAVVSAYNDAKVTLDDVVINSWGVARLSLFVDNYADALVTDSEINVWGGTLYDGYKNNADMATMVAPPWVLGITGNARGTNMIGSCPSTTVVRSDVTANQWGVLSTDSGSDMLLTVVDSTLTLAGKDEKDPYSTNYGSGYGTYIIGGAQEYFYGVTFNVGTYASILTGGDAVYASSRFSHPLSIYPLTHVANGTTITDFMGNTIDGYDVVASKTPVFTGITGFGKITTINSDAFGFMAHNSGSLTITDDTVVNTDNATFLIKSGDVDLNVSDGAKINTSDGVILQMIDNDDAIVGATMVGGGPVFNTDFYEKAGYPGIDYSVNVTTAGRNTVNFNAEDVTLKGNLYNATGYFGGNGTTANQAADKLNVSLGKDSTLTGAISAASAIHVNEKGVQNEHFTIDEYYYLGHVANKNYYNGGNDISVTLKDNAVWKVTGSSIITGLTISEGSTLTAEAGKALYMYVNGAYTPIQTGTYSGEIKLVVQ
jgi:hypothetical protein